MLHPTYNIQNFQNLQDFPEFRVEDDIGKILYYKTQKLYTMA